MRTLTLAVLAALAVGGCHRHSHDDDPASNWYVTYGNGHPLAATPDDGFIVDQENDLATRINNHRVSISVPALIDRHRLPRPRLRVGTRGARGSPWPGLRPS